MDFFAGFRGFCARFDIFLASMIEKIYGLILDIASVNLVNGSIERIINKVYMIMGLFMLFKLALSIINYIVNPDNILSKDKGVGKFIQRIVISLALISVFPVIFTEMYNLQTIILSENIIGKIIMGKSNAKGEMENAGKEVAYFVFSNFLDYSREGALSIVFTSDCRNIFIEEDYDMSTVFYGGKSYCGSEGVIVNTCAHFLTPYNNITYDEYDAACGPAEDRYVEGSTCMKYLDLDSRFDKNGNVGYYSCKAGEPGYRGISYPTINCGIKNGLYIFELINKGREERDVSYILSNEVITATESDPLFQISSYCPNPAIKYLYGGKAENDVTDSNGDFVFSYKVIFSSIVGIIVLVMFIIMAVDVAIRAIKLAFLQMIAPIPIVSNIDIKESKLFKDWLKILISTYLELFIKLATIFFSLLLITTILNGDSETFEVIKQNGLAKIVFIIGAILFAIKMPKFLSDLIGIKSNGGLMSIIKGTGKFVLGVGAMGVASVGGSVSNLASGIQEKKGVAKTALSMIAGGNSAALRTLGNQIKNKGNVSLYDIKSGIRGSVMARKQNDAGRHIGVRVIDKFRDLSQINPLEHFSSEEIKKEIELIEQKQAQNNNDIAIMLSNNRHASQLRDAFRVDSDYKRVYDDYDAYHLATNSELTQEEYDDASYLFDMRDKLQKELKEYKDKYKQEVENEEFKKAKK